MSYFSQYRGGANSVLPPGYMQAVSQMAAQTAGVGDAVGEAVEKWITRGKLNKNMRGAAIAAKELELGEALKSSDPNIKKSTKGMFDAYKARIEDMNHGELLQETSRIQTLFGRQDEAAKQEYMAAQVETMKRRNQPASNVLKQAVDESGQPIPGIYVNENGTPVKPSNSSQVTQETFDIGGQRYTYIDGKQVGEPVPILTEEYQAEVQKLQAEKAKLLKMQQSGETDFLYDDDGNPTKDTFGFNWSKDIKQRLKKIDEELAKYNRMAKPMSRPDAAQGGNVLDYNDL